MVMEGRAAMAEEEGALKTSTPQKETDVVEELVGMIRSVGRFGDFRKTQKTECVSLLRRMKLLLPLLEEIRDRNGPIPATALPVLSSLKKVFAMAMKLLKTCNEGSKIYLALEIELITSRFHTIYDRLGQALASLPCDELGVSDEVGEQIDLMCMQLKRAKRRTDTQDIELAMDMMVVFSKKDGRNADSAIIERLATKLDLHTFEDLDMETKAVRNLIHERGTTNVESIEHIKNLLNKFRNVAGMVEVKDLDNPVILKKLKKSPSLIIPHEFLCPITLEIMTDPVIVATGQTYERESIQKWLDNDQRTCPTSRDTLAHLSLAPNYALKNLISQWCESNNYKLPKKQTPPLGPERSNENTEEISSLVGKLWSSQLEVQREAVKNIRLLSKECPENRIQIAKTGGIPPLVHLLSYPDSKIQEHAVTALLNLSIDETNKKLITIEGAIPAIIEVLQHGNTEARENSAAALFSLSMLDGNKETVGLSNGIPALVTLLQDGTIRGKKDALTALFNLSLNHSNKGRAIEAGIAQPLLQLVRDKNLHMVDEALSVVLLLASHPDGRQEIGQIPFIGTLVEYIRDGTPKNKECAISVLLELGINNSSYILAALQFGVYEHLAEVSQSGTNRAQRKANALIQLMSQSEQIPSDLSVSKV